MNKPKEKFIRNVLDVDVDGLKQMNRYVIKAMYDVEQEDGFYDIEHRLIEDVKLSWDEIEERGGVSKVYQEFKERYDLQK